MKKAWLISVLFHIFFLLLAFLTVNWSLPDLNSEDLEALPIQVTAISSKNSMRKGELTAPKTKPASPKESKKEKVEAKYNNPEKSNLDTDKALDKWGDEKISNAHASQDLKKAQPKTLKQEKKQSEDKTKTVKEIASDKAPEKKKEPEKDKAKEKDPAEKTAVPKPKQKDVKNSNKDDNEDDIDKLIKESLLIDKTRTKGGGKNSAQGEAGYGGKEDIGEDDLLAQTLSAKISSCVRSKFNIIALGGGFQTDLKIHIRFTLRDDGSIDKIEEISATGGDTGLQEIGINQAGAALRYCSPFDLPRDKYNIWREIDMIFDPYATE